MRLRPRTLFSIVTAVIVVVILFFLRDELKEAWRLLGQVNIWILLLLIPVQAIAYYAAGAIIFSYLKQQGELKNTPSWETGKMALELNFVNHILPSAGVSGASYMTWRLRQLGVGAGRATLAQVVRFVATFAAFVMLLLIAVLLITLDGSITRLTILFSSGLVSLIVFGTIALMYILNGQRRMYGFSRSVGSAINGFGSKILRRKNDYIDQRKINKFFNDIHEDYIVLKNDPRPLKRPLLWGIVANIAEVALFLIVFAALGSIVNPAQVLLAFGLATVVGAFLVTPGGAGGYEAVMIFSLSASGMNEGLAFAGVLLTRVLLILGTIATGYFFYQKALNKYGKHPTDS